MAQANIQNFNRRLWLSGGRNQAPQGSMRRCINAAPELTGSVMSRYGSTLLYAINSISLTRYNGSRFQYDGSHLYRDGISIDSGYDGSRLAFVKMAPNLGVADYLFLAGGGKLVKVAPDGTVTNWGIEEPRNSMVANNVVYDQTIIDTFDGSVANWTPNGNCTTADENTESIVGTGSLKINPSAGPWRIVKTTGAPYDLSNYTNADISLETDLIQFWIYFSGSFNSTWIQLDFDVDDATFKKNFYTFGIGLVSAGSTNPVVKHNVNTTIQFQQGQWQQISIVKSEFNRIGTALQKDWSNVRAIRFSGGNFSSYALLDQFTLSGGSPMGAGPAASSGGSEYEYFSTFLNLTTGNISNPNADSVKIFDVAVNSVSLRDIPVSTDSQVGARQLWRTSAENLGGGQAAFYLDTIYDNTTTTYTDKAADSAMPIVVTPWQKSIAVAPNTGAAYYIDAGNGYYFKLKTNGTTGANPPTWAIPTTSWVPLSQFVVNDTVAPRAAGGVFYKVTAVSGAGKSGVVEPNWASLAATITDNEITWTSIGAQDTTDNTAVWTFQGINSPRILGNTQIRFDNAHPLSTYDDAVGPFQGCMFWCRDSTSGAKGRVYFSPGGRAESVSDFIDVSTDDDPTQKLVIWDRQLWCVTTQRVYPILPLVAPDGSTTFTKGDPVLGAKGTQNPFSVLPSTRGVIYEAADGIRVLDNGYNGLVAFDALAPVLRGQQVENIQPFSPLIAAETRGEILFSNLSIAFGLIVAQEAPVWRMINLPLTAMSYEDDTGSIVAAWGGNTYLMEASGVFSDNGTPISLEWQTPSVLVNEGQYALIQRVYIDIDCNSQVLTPTLLVDDSLSPSFYTMPSITNTARGTIEIPFQKSAKLLGLRLTGNASQRVELFGMAWDLSPSEA